MSLNTPSYQLYKESKAEKEFQNDFQEQSIKECNYAPRTTRGNHQQHHHNRIIDVCSQLGSKSYLSEKDLASQVINSKEKQFTLVDFMASLNDMQLEFMKSFLETWSQYDTNIGKKETVSEQQHISKQQHKQHISRQQQQYQEILDFCHQNNLDISNINAFNSAETIVLG